MKTLLIACAIGLTGCATTDTSNMTDEQRAVTLQYLLSRPQPSYQVQPYYIRPYTPPAPVYQAPQQRFCQSQRIGNYTHTQCF